MFTDFIAEMGDKTQFMLVGLTSKYKFRDIILGTFVAILVLNGLAVVIGGVLNQVLNNYLWLVKFIAAAAFIYFAVTSLKKDDDEDEEAGESKFKLASVAVFCTFFVAELGDKTQLTAVTFGATYGLSSALIVWLACSVGLFAADMVGMLVAYFLKKKAPEGFLNMLSFVLFTIFGFYTVWVGLTLFFGGNPFGENPAPLLPFVIVMASVLAVYAVLCGIIIHSNKKNESSQK